MNVLTKSPSGGIIQAGTSCRTLNVKVIGSDSHVVGLASVWAVGRSFISSVAAMEQCSKIFLYGTLKSGQPNHSVLTNVTNGDATLIGSGRTMDRWPLVIGSQINAPLLLPAQGQGKVCIYVLSVPKTDLPRNLLYKSMYTLYIA